MDESTEKLNYLERFLLFLEINVIGIIVTVFLIWFILFTIKFLASVFGWGRFKGQEMKTSQVYGIIRHLLVTIINDFRHLLALIITLIFAVILIYMVITETQDKSGALQTVMASIGTLITAILGYYFGESSLKKKSETESSTQKTDEEIILPTEPIEEIPDGDDASV